MAFLTGLAQLSGATEQEIQEANRMATVVGRHNEYLKSIQYDMDQFMRELKQIADHMQKAAQR